MILTFGEKISVEHGSGEAFTEIEILNMVGRLTIFLRETKMIYQTLDPYSGKITLVKAMRD